MYGASGKKATWLVDKLQKLIEKHGDQIVYTGGGDYPEGVTGVRLISEKEADGYIPENVFYID